MTLGYLHPPPEPARQLFGSFRHSCRILSSSSWIPPGPRQDDSHLRKPPGSCPGCASMARRGGIVSISYEDSLALASHEVMRAFPAEARIQEW